MDRTREIADLERLIAVEKAEIADFLLERQANLAALRAKLEFLRRGVEATEITVRTERTDAVEEVLRSARRPLAPAEIVQALEEVGRVDTAALVSATLSYLQGQGRVRRLGRGQWVAAG